MKKIIAAVLALSLVPAAAEAAGWPPYRVEIGGNFYLRVNSVHGIGGQLVPWYQYWPLEAHFQIPAPCAYPFWPAHRGVPRGGVGATHFPMAAPPGGKAAPSQLNFHSQGIKPISYQSGVPSYWYGR